MQEIKSTRSFMITNTNLNSIFKPNYKSDKFTKTVGSTNFDSAIQITNGKLNHHRAMIFDIIFDKMYRMFNQKENFNFIHSSISRLLSGNDPLRQHYFKKFLTDSKMDFFYKVKSLINLSIENPDMNIPYNQSIRNFLLNGASDIIDNAFPIEFVILYRNELERECEKTNSFNKVISLLIEYQFEKNFYLYLLENIFDNKMSSWTYQLDIKLSEIFLNDERSIYHLKSWFLESEFLELNMTYPITCFADPDSDKYVPKKLYLKNIMHPLESITPIQNVNFDKSSMTISFNLRNHFMAFLAHDARMCVGTFIPSYLYKLKSSAFFLGKNILNTSYYDRIEKKYKNKMKYNMNQLFNYLNLSDKDHSSNNSSHRRKMIYKSLQELADMTLIGIDKLTDKELVLNKVWNISDLKEC